MDTLVKIKSKVGMDNLSLSDQAYRLLEAMIATMTLAPGAPISESQLSILLGIGRTPIREALQRLSREHLVTILPKRGIFISDLNPQKQLRVLETRRELERLICKKAAKRSTNIERAEFIRIAKEFRRAAKEKNNDLFIKIDKELNDLTIKAAKNEYAAAAMTTLHGMSRRFWFGNFNQAVSISTIAALHAKLADKIAEGHEEAAGHALDKLLDYIEDFTRRTVLPDD